MAKVVITIEDKPDGDVDCAGEFTPPIFGIKHESQELTMAQMCGMGFLQAMVEWSKEVQEKQ